MRDDSAGDDVVAALVDVVSPVAALRGTVAGCPAWPSAVRRRVLCQLDALGTAIGLMRGPVVLAEREAGSSLRVGDRSFESAAGRASGKGFVEARREVRQAETLATMPAVARAVEAGGMTLAHVDAIGKVAVGAGGASGAVLSAEAGQAALVELARGRDAGEFGKELARYVAAHDPAAHERDHATQRAERYLVLSDQPTGTYLKGRLDRFAGERLRLALEATGCAPDADRDRTQAMADALAMLADEALTGSGSGGSQRRPHVSLLLREDTFATLLADRDARSYDQPDEPRAHVTTPAPAALTESGLALPRSEVARILCDATIARIVVDADDVPLDLGADKRLYGGAQRRAVIVRDKSCAWPGCTIPARWAEVHHIRWWARDRGETSVENGVPLCEHHHHLVHQHDLDVRRHVPGHARAIQHGATPVGPGVNYTFHTRAGRLVAPTPSTALSPGATRALAADVRATSTGPPNRAGDGSEVRPAAPGRRAIQTSLLDEPAAAGPPGTPA